MLRRTALAAIALAGLAACTTQVAPTAPTPANPIVGGAPMYPTKDIVDNAVNSADHTTLVAAVKAAGLVDTLKGPGPFTVFAPTNDAFKALPAGTVDTLLKPQNKAALTKVLTYHVVPGRYDSAAIKALAERSGGGAVLPTVEGDNLTILVRPNGNLSVVDSKGTAYTVTIPDVYQSNGVIHVINGVLLPPRM